MHGAELLGKPSGRTPQHRFHPTRVFALSLHLPFSHRYVMKKMPHYWQIDSDEWSLSRRFWAFDYVYKSVWKSRTDGRIFWHCSSKLSILLARTTSGSKVAKAKWQHCCSSIFAHKHAEAFLTNHALFCTHSCEKRFSLGLVTRMEGRSYSEKKIMWLFVKQRWWEAVSLLWMEYETPVTEEEVKNSNKVCKESRTLTFKKNIKWTNNKEKQQK